MALLHEMLPEEIAVRLENDTSFGMMSDAVAAEVIARDSVSAAHYRRAMIRYFQDKKTWGPWMDLDTAPGE